MASRLEKEWAAGTTFLPELDALPRMRMPGEPGAIRMRLRSLRRLLGWMVRPYLRLRLRNRIIISLLTLFAVLASWLYFGPASLAGHPPLQNAFLYDRNGELLAELSPEQNRVLVSINRVPKVVQDAFVAAEDERFWSHPGVDIFAIGRALVADVRGGSQGASTITQQYVKNAFVGSRRTIGRKVREAILALRIDRRYSKKEILQAYLNEIYLGEGAYGIEAASRLYFGKHAWQIGLAEGAVLAGLAVAPSRLSPRSNRSGALARRNYVLERMRKMGFITDAQAAAALVAPLRLVRPRPRKVVAPMFVDWARRNIIEEVGEDNLYRGGLRVTTSLDLRGQRAAEAAIADLFPGENDPEVSVVSVDIASGAVRVMVGGRNKRLGDFNLATQGRRPPGSAFKPFVLAAALLKGKGLGDTYPAPGSIRLRFDGHGVWPVGNYDRRGYGRLSLKRATAYSVNTVFAQLIRDVGIENVIDVARRLGIRSPLQGVPALALGISGVTPLEMASAYSAFFNDGLWAKPSALEKVSTEDAKLLFDSEREPQIVLPPDVADGVEEALAAVTRYGTGSRVRLRNFKVSGKTGTTENHRDAWFVGAGAGIVTAVWMGHPASNAPMTKVHGIRVTGGSFPASIWMKTMEALLEGQAENRYPGMADSRNSTPSTSSSPLDQQSPEPEPSEEPSPSPTPRRFPIVIPTLRPDP